MWWVTFGVEALHSHPEQTYAWKYSHNGHLVKEHILPWWALMGLQEGQLTVMSDTHRIQDEEIISLRHYQFSLKEGMPDLSRFHQSCHIQSVRN